MQITHRTLDPYKIACLIVPVLGALLISTIILDWMFPSGTRATQLGVDNADRTIPHLIRAMILFILVVYVASTGLDPGGHAFALGRPLFLIGGALLFSALYSTADTRIVLKELIKSLTWIVASVASYRLSLSGHVTLARVRNLCMIVVSIAAMWTLWFCLDPSRRIGQNADASLLLWCLPLLLLSRPKLWGFVFVLLAAAAIFSTVKRGAILALVIGFSSYTISLNYISRHEIMKLKNVIVLALLVLVMIAGISWQWNNIMFRNEREMDRGEIGSGRNEFYRYIFNEWYYSDGIGILFGRGFYTVPETLNRVAGYSIYAHSDWLEILHDMGIVGISLFLYLHHCMILLIRRAIRERDVVAPALIMGYCIFVLRGIYSQAFIGGKSLIFFGILLGVSSANITGIKKWGRS